MASAMRGRFYVSAQDATSATLTPVAGEKATPDFADVITSIVVTFTTARDAKFFDVTNRKFDVVIEKK